MGRTTGLNDVLSNFTYFDEEDMEFRLSGLGEEVAIRAIATMLETDIKHPELWAANRLRGLHEIDIAGAFTHQGAHGVKPLLMMMERAGLIHINDNLYPDRITLFKVPLMMQARSQTDLKEQIKHTLWHEIAHYYGLNHDQIRAKE
jgi:hypothetical protein